MVKFINKTIFSCIFILTLSPVFAQDKIVTAENFRFNSLGFYVGLIELNINYERTIMQRPKSHSNLRAGAGYWTNLQLEGNYINAAFVHLSGKNNSHLELNLGVKYLFAKDRKDNTFLPDIFAGYRFEKPDGRIFFRAGIAFPALFSVGMGVKI